MGQGENGLLVTVGPKYADDTEYVLPFQNSGQFYTSRYLILDENSVLKRVDEEKKREEKEEKERKKKSRRVRGSGRF